MHSLIAENRKMHGMAPQLGEIKAIATSTKATPPPADILICLPAMLIARAVQTATGRMVIGGEDCSAEIAVAFTADLSAEMLKDADACAVIVGRSEHRQHHGETDAIVVAKAGAARRGVVGDHLHRRDERAAAQRQGLVWLRRSDRRQRVRGREFIFSARQGAEDDAMNVFCLSGKVIGSSLAMALISTFLTTRFSNAARHRHRRRLAKTQAIETDKIELLSVPIQAHPGEGRMTALRGSRAFVASIGLLEV